jgi:ABC-type transporter Mla subunit MlaD
MRLIIAISVLTLFSGCNSSDYTLNLLVKRTGATQISGDIKCQDSIVGKIGDVLIVDDSSMIVKMSIYRNAKIPRGSEFKLISKDNFGSRTVNINKSNSDKFLSDGDTIVAVFADINYPLEKHNLSVEDSALIHNSIQSGIDSLERFVQKK